jgi:hypothetical protein
MHERTQAHERTQTQQRTQAQQRTQVHGRAQARRRPRRRWLLAAIVAAAVALPLVAFAVTRLHSGGSDGLSNKLRAELAAEVQTILETSPVILQVVQADHDHGEGGPARVMCAVDPFGIGPDTATSASQVQWVYAQHICALASPGMTWNFATKSAGPVAVSLLNPPSVRLPQPRQDYRTQVREMIPAKYLTQAFGTFEHPDLVAQLRQKFNDEVASASPVHDTPTP